VIRLVPTIRKTAEDDDDDEDEKDSEMTLKGYLPWLISPTRQALKGAIR
jgi:hypothetical protein